MSAYYNEIDPKAAAWLRELIKQGHIATGEVDERSIVDVRPDDLAGFSQCHFFAGIGVWSYALRRAGWPDDRPVWTGSCPCQPFSAAGKGDGYADERHLWPHWYRLIRECRPPIIFGEQVDAAIRTGWLDDVCLSLESDHYAVGAISFPACSVGAPHIRQRLYFVADAQQRAAERHGHEVGSAPGGMQGAPRQQWVRDDLGDGIDTGELAHPPDPRRPGAREHECGQPQLFARPVEHGGLGDTEINGCERRPLRANGEQANRTTQASQPTNGFWADAEWIACRDGKARPTEPGTSPLVTGAPARVVQLRGYGNAINAEQAKAFIESYLEARAA